MRKRMYRSVAVKSVNLDELLSRLPGGRVWVGVDVGKRELFVTLLDACGSFHRPWKVKQPEELGFLVGHLARLSQERPTRIAMESTGTYGDCLRQALMDGGLIPERVSAKAVQDHSETFDGVPSNHDGKDAAVIAELASFGKSHPWPIAPAGEWAAEVDQQVHWLDAQQEILQLWLGRLEALLARHWPELTSLLELNSATLLRLLAEYGSPQAVAESPKAEEQLIRWGRSGLTPSKVAAVLASARSSRGVRMASPTVFSLQQCAREALRARKEIAQTKASLRKLGSANETTAAMSQAVGMVTACVLFATVGNPEEFHCAEAYRKAMGLNLRERSSGQHQGKLKITKRGSSIARRWLYFAALRLIQQHPVKGWYERKKAKDQGRGTGAVVAVMRKLALAVHVVTTDGVPFEVSRVLPGRPLTRKSLGALPPDPQDLAHDAEPNGVKEGRPGTNPDAPPPSSTAPGMALGAVPTVALSSTRFTKT